tara:strand:+ start:950268 stop:951926 length:1659 start_codon:yes stop_codon:yes gene_type:complete
LLLWFAQPPLAIWPVAFIALVPLIVVAQRADKLTRRDCLLIWCAGSIYWLVTLEGLRHAHPAMYACWIALSDYLAIYFVLFVLILRRLTVYGVPSWISIPSVWVGLECVRNYLLSGISAAMLGHTMADVPVMTQVADLFGSYGVSFVVALVNTAFVLLWNVYRRQATYAQVRVPLVVAGAVVGGTIAYGIFRLSEDANDSDPTPLATFALIQRNEAVDYAQDVHREIEIAENFAEQSVKAAVQAKESAQTIDAVVWPESTFTSGVPWYFAEDNAKIPATIPLSREEFDSMILQGQETFLRRAFQVQEAVRSTGDFEKQPHLIVGTAIFRYAQRPFIHSGIAHVAPSQRIGDHYKRPELADWYAKTHLVLFGEYVPFAGTLQRFGIMLPRVDVGPGPKHMVVNETVVSPNICIETAVERVTVNQVAELRSEDHTPDVIVTVTNDGWFDDSSIPEHHLRCAQLVGVSIRRPILSAANNGPTAWIDSSGRVVERLAQGTNGSIIATPQRDARISLYLRIGDWPARLLALLCAVVIVELAVSGWRNRRTQRDASEA